MCETFGSLSGRSSLLFNRDSRSKIQEDILRRLCARESDKDQIARGGVFGRLWGKKREEGKLAVRGASFICRHCGLCMVTCMSQGAR